MPPALQSRIDKGDGKTGFDSGTNDLCLELHRAIDGDVVAVALQRQTQRLLQPLARGFSGDL